MKQLPDSLVVASAAVGHGDRVHSTSPQDRILVPSQTFDQGVGLLQPAVHHKGDAHGQTAQDLLMLCLLGVGHHVLDGAAGLASKFAETHAQTEAATMLDLLAGSLLHLAEQVLDDLSSMIG